MFRKKQNRNSIVEAPVVEPAVVESVMAEDPIIEALEYNAEHEKEESSVLDSLIAQIKYHKTLENFLNPGSSYHGLFNSFGMGFRKEEATSVYEFPHLKIHYQILTPNASVYAFKDHADKTGECNNVNFIGNIQIPALTLIDALRVIVKNVVDRDQLQCEDRLRECAERIILREHMYDPHSITYENGGSHAEAWNHSNWNIIKTHGRYEFWSNQGSSEPKKVHEKSIEDFHCLMLGSNYKEILGDNRIITDVAKAHLIRELTKLLDNAKSNDYEYRPKILGANEYEDRINKLEEKNNDLRSDQDELLSERDELLNELDELRSAVK